ncbi:MAG: ZIP family metal transporter [Clostridia bacterium]|nr:ZIP family metal transporter [Clostridia bacterium]
MNNTLYSIIGITIPFIGTVFGSGFVLLLKKNLNEKLQKLIVGFAAGVMIAASIWSLILPSAELAEEQGIINWIPATIGFILGIIFLILTNYFADNVAEKRKGKKINMLMFSVTLHNIPEGMAVGVCFAGFLAGNTGIALMAAMALSIGIALQNIPEGAIISIPLKLQGMSKRKSLLYGMLSGIVEPIAAIVTILLLNIIVPLLPYLLSFAAGAMIYVVMEELIPEMHRSKKSVLGVIGVTIGFVLMMIMDMAL